MRYQEAQLLRSLGCIKGQRLCNQKADFVAPKRTFRISAHDKTMIPISRTDWSKKVVSQLGQYETGSNMNCITFRLMLDDVWSNNINSNLLLQHQASWPPRLIHDAAAIARRCTGSAVAFGADLSEGIRVKPDVMCGCFLLNYHLYMFFIVLLLAILCCVLLVRSKSFV